MYRLEVSICRKLSILNFFDLFDLETKNRPLNDLWFLVQCSSTWYGEHLCRKSQKVTRQIFFKITFFVKNWRFFEKLTLNCPKCPTWNIFLQHFYLLYQTLGYLEDLYNFLKIFTKQYFLQTTYSTQKYDFWTCGWSWGKWG